MKQARRTCLQGILNHCYQRTRDGFLLFYDVTDCLVYFTLFCTVAPKYKVHVLALCLMPDHVHITVAADRTEDLSSFLSEVSRRFVRSQNAVCHRRGCLFEHPFGSVPKKGAKKARANLIYVGNNPVERQLCCLAEEYRWNFLSYDGSDHPFSEKLVVRNASWPLRRALREIRAMHHGSRPLTYPQLHRLYHPLDERETEQLTDWIVSLYSVIDHGAAARFFDGSGRMLEAMHTNTGSEYDLNEPFVGRSDACYASMGIGLMQRLHLADIHDLFRLSEDVRLRLLPDLLRIPDATLEQAAKYLRLKLKRRN
jgi:putative transposase